MEEAIVPGSGSVQEVSLNTEQQAAFDSVMAKEGLEYYAEELRTVLATAETVPLPVDLTADGAKYYGAKWRWLPLPPERDALVQASRNTALVLPRRPGDANFALFHSLGVLDAYQNDQPYTYEEKGPTKGTPVPGFDRKITGPGFNDQEVKTFALSIAKFLGLKDLTDPERLYG
ncbi:MAG: hypothetical protein WC640_02470 [Candidatus Paceibacterota bacterium]|jgi:hypothetical protein